MTIQELADKIGVDYYHARNLVTKCQFCNGSIVKDAKNPCTCGKKEPLIRPINVGRNSTNVWRISEEEVEKFIEERTL